MKKRRDICEDNARKHWRELAYQDWRPQKPEQGEELPESDRALRHQQARHGEKSRRAKREENVLQYPELIES